MLNQEKINRFEISLQRSMKERIRNGYIKTYRPVLDDCTIRIFSTMVEYKKWCNEKLPKFLGMYQYKDLINGKKD